MLFNVFQLWAYTGSPLPDKDSLKDTKEFDLIQLYLFAERYGIPDLQNSTMDLLNSKIDARSRTPTNHVRYIYANSNDSSPLRRLLIVRCAQRGDLEYLSDPRFEYLLLPAFLLDLVTELFRVRQSTKKPSDWDKLGCTFHVHPASAQESRQAACVKKD